MKLTLVSARHALAVPYGVAQDRDTLTLREAQYQYVLVEAGLELLEG